LDEIPESWRAALRKLAEEMAPLSEEQRRGLTRVAVRFARKKRLEAMRAEIEGCAVEATSEVSGGVGE